MGQDKRNDREKLLRLLTADPSSQPENPNGRGNGALRKLGAVQEGILRRSFLCNGQYLDQALWSILEDDWRRVKETRRPTIH